MVFTIFVTTLFAYMASYAGAGGVGTSVIGKYHSLAQCEAVAKQIREANAKRYVTVTTQCVQTNP